MPLLACRNWLRRYRLQRYGVEGNASVYNLYRQDLRTWYYADQLTPQDITDKLYEVHGVLVPDVPNLVSWLKADSQKPEKLEFNEAIHAHASGEYALLQLQNGNSPENVVSELMSRYLVHATVERVVAYRHYREQIGTYWTRRRLERLHWEYLYGFVTSVSKLGGHTGHVWSKRYKLLQAVRAMLCARIEVAEELIPVKVFVEFFAKHEEYARLSSKYPEAIILKDTLPLSLIDAYRSTFATDEVLPDVANKMFAPKQYRGAWRASQVAQDAGYIAFPRACGDAALVAAYAMQKCREVFQYHCMHGSRLTPIQHEYRNTYPEVDFRF